MCLTNTNLFVVTGGPGSGKTTLLEELAHLGFPYAPEIARQIIQEQVKAGGKALPWDDQQAYTALMLQRSIESFLCHPAGSMPIFTDRGIPDVLGYARLIGLSDTLAIQNACRRYRYAPLVFLAPPWEAIYETDTERKQDFAEARRTAEALSSVYRDCGYKLIELPRVTPAERARFVLAKLRSPQIIIGE